MTSITSALNTFGPKSDVAFEPVTQSQKENGIPEQPDSTISKTNRISLGIILGGILVAALVIGACVASGIGIAAIVAAVVPLSMILALKTGAAVGAAAGLILTPLALYLIKHYVLKRDIPKAELQKFDEAITAELENPLLDGTRASALGEYCQNDGFITANATESLEFKLKLIEQAEQSIEIMPNYFSGEVMAKTLDIIEQQLEFKKGLKARIMASSQRIETKEEWKRFDNLKTKFKGRFDVIFIPFMPTIDPELKLCDSHMKMVVVDEKYFVLGGSSLIDEFSGDGEKKPNRPSKQKILDRILAAGFRDHDLVGKGPLAKTLRLAFYRQYATWEYMLNRKQKKLENHYFSLEKEGRIAEIETVDLEKRLISGAKMKLIISTPHTSLENPCTKEYQRIISKAQELEIGNLDFDPPEPILEALDQALDNGAKLKILTNGIEGTEIPLQNYFMALPPKSHYRRLNRSQQDDNFIESPNNNRSGKVRKEIEVFEYDVPDTSYHAKVLAAKSKDGIEEGVIGSYNLSYRGDTGDDELIVVFENSDLVHQVQELLEIDRKLSRKVTIEEKPSWTERIATPIDNLFFRFI